MELNTELIYSLMRKQGLNIAKLAQAIGMGNGLYITLRTDRMSIETERKLSAYFGLGIHELLKKKEGAIENAWHNEFRRPYLYFVRESSSQTAGT